jgi:hypothetical protein
MNTALLKQLKIISVEPAIKLKPGRPVRDKISVEPTIKLKINRPVRDKNIGSNNSTNNEMPNGTKQYLSFPLARNGCAEHEQRTPVQLIQRQLKSSLRL